MKLFMFFISFILTTNFTYKDSPPLNKVIDEPSISNAQNFATFLSHFERVENPIDIDHLIIEDYKCKYLMGSTNNSGQQILSRDVLQLYVPEWKFGSFSRVGPPIVYPLNRYYKDENTIAVTYLTKHRYSDFGFSVLLAFYDLQGNFLSKTGKSKSKKRRAGSILIGGFNGDRTTFCSFDDKNSFLRKTFKNNWKVDLRINGYKDNSIANYEILKSEAVSISSNGAVSSNIIKPSYAGLD